MGVNLVPEVKEFRLLDREFVRRDHKTSPNQVADGSVEDDCISEGRHLVLRFDFYCHNIGDKDLVIGDPASRLDLYKNVGNRWILKDKFNIFSLTNDAGVKYGGTKVVFCIEDDSGDFDCSYQGISAGNFDLYEKSLPCNFIVVDGIADGDYTFEAITNATSVEAARENVKPIPIEEDNYDDNTIHLRLRIQNGQVDIS
jgi:lysyl oxidase